MGVEIGFLRVIELSKLLRQFVMFLHGFSTFRMRKYSCSASKLDFPFDPFPGTRCLILKPMNEDIYQVLHIYYILSPEIHIDNIFYTESYKLIKATRVKSFEMIYEPKWDERYTWLPIVKWSNLNEMKAAMIARRDVGANYWTSINAQIRVTGENAQDDSDSEDDLVLVKKLALVLGWHGREGEVPAQEVD